MRRGKEEQNKPKVCRTKQMMKFIAGINRTETHSRKSVTPRVLCFKDLKNGQHGQLYVNKLLNLNEMDKILETHKLAKLTLEEMESLSRSLINKQTEAVIRTQQGKRT